MTIEIHGHCDPRFQPLEDAFRANFDERLEVGASVAMTHQGKTVLDLWAGHRDWARTKPWVRDTVVQVYSAAKIATIFSLLTLVDRGLVDLDAPVAAYWPEFAAGGKGRVTVREAMSHRAGVPGFVPALTFETLHDWHAVCANIASQDHWFGGETTVHYHNMTYGFLLGEIIRRVDGRGPAQFFYEEIGDKAGIDLQIGLRSPAERERLAEIGSLEPIEWPPMDPVSDRVNMSLEAVDWSAWYLAAEVPAVGYANGRSLARICAIGAMRGELDGTRYLSPEIIDEACRRQAYTELLLYSPGALGLGFGLPSEAFHAPTPTCAHWGGFGGSQWLFDPASGVSYGYAMNNMVLNGEADHDLRWQRLWDALGEVMAAL